MEIGDKLYCYKNYFGSSKSDYKLFENNYYKIFDINEYIGFISVECEPYNTIKNTNYIHLIMFSLNKEDTFYYGNWLCDIRKLRKIKLEKIKKLKI